MTTPNGEFNWNIPAKSDGNDRDKDGTDQADELPEYVPDEIDMEELARSYLQSSVESFRFSFITGICEEESDYLIDRFERVVRHLGESSRMKMIDDLDCNGSSRDGDNWQVFKSTFRPGFFSTPADYEAVCRAAKALPQMTDYSDAFSDEHIDLLQAVREKENYRYDAD